MIIGHSMSDANGIIQSIDESVAVVLQRTQTQLVGMSYITITHPADHASNLSQIAALQPNHAPLTIRKRYIGGEGDIITLEVQVSRLGDHCSGHLVGTLSTVDSPGPSHARPQILWQRAKDLLEIRRARDEILGGDLFVDHAWTLLLLVYVAEAESRIAAATTITRELGLPRATVDRWIRALQSKSLLEPIDPCFGALQLTHNGIDGIERLLDAPMTAGVS